MKEFRIVATIDAEHGDGRTDHFDTATPMFDGTKPADGQFKTKTDAVKAKAIIKMKCKDFDAKSRREFEKDPATHVKYTQTNIRIQVRDVTEWANVE